MARFTPENGYTLDTSPTIAGRMGEAGQETAYLYIDEQVAPGEAGRIVVTRDNETVAGEFPSRITALVALMCAEV